MRAHDRRDACRKVLDRALRKAIPDDGPRDFDAELREVWATAVEWAMKHGGHVPTMDTVLLIDAQAAGHVDWFSKLTLRVADYVVFGDYGQP